MHGSPYGSHRGQRHGKQSQRPRFRRIRNGNGVQVRLPASVLVVGGQDCPGDATPPEPAIAGTDDLRKLVRLDRSRPGWFGKISRGAASKLPPVFLKATIGAGDAVPPKLGAISPSDTTDCCPFALVATR